MFEQRNSKVLCGHIHVALKNEDDMQHQIILESVVGEFRRLMKKAV
ncbi:hypothetical protein [Sulfurospirillum deleyianum]|nr:hypothetical protein [Sulfurospirillum deleyianum]